MDNPDKQLQEEDDISRLLRAAGPREQLNDELKRRWEGQFRAALEPVLAQRRQGRRRVIMALCATVAMVAVALSFTVLTPPPAQPLALISHVIGDNQLQLPGRSSQALLAGGEVPTGSVISTGESGHIGMQYGDYDLRLNSGTRLTILDDRIALEVGEIYASDYGSTGREHNLRIDTAQGTIRDIGTQFTVLALPDRTVTTVRRGAVLVNTGSQQLRAESLPGSASRLTIDQQQQVQRESVAPDGAQWRWIYRGGAGFELEGRSAYDFLLWSVGESGLQLEFASDSAEIHARTILLHGNIGTLDPEQAVSPVLASTDLVAERKGPGTLLVALNLNRE